VPDLAGKGRPVIRADPGHQGLDGLIGAELRKPVQQPHQLVDHRLLRPPAADPSERLPRQPGQRHAAAAERASDVAGAQRNRYCQASPAKRSQQRHRGGQPAPGFLVAGQPVGHLIDEDHVVELASYQPGIPAGSGKTQHRQVTGQPLTHPSDNSQRRPRRTPPTMARDIAPSLAGPDG
jgi:hypothetical protein